MLGAMKVLVPDREKVFSKLVVRALIAGTIACFLTACIAGKCIVFTSLKCKLILTWFKVCSLMKKESKVDYNLIRDATINFERIRTTLTLQ